MLDMGWTEILVIGVVALIVVGPKDLPRMLRTLGQYTGKMRGMAREFQRSMNDAANEADLAEFKDISKSINDVRSIQSDAASTVNKALSQADREINKAADLTDDDPAPSSAAPSSTAPASTTSASAETTKSADAAVPADTGKPAAPALKNPQTSSAPVDRPDPSATGAAPAAKPADVSAPDPQPAETPRATGT